jgi:hypothetical protein
MVAALIATVYVLTRLTRNMEHTDIGSTGEGEGLEDFMLVSEVCACFRTEPHQLTCLDGIVPNSSVLKKFKAPLL